MSFMLSSKPNLTVLHEERGRRGSWRDKLRWPSRSRDKSQNIQHSAPGVASQAFSRLVFRVKLSARIDLTLEEILPYLCTMGVPLPPRRPRCRSCREKPNPKINFKPTIGFKIAKMFKPSTSTPTTTIQPRMFLLILRTPRELLFLKTCGVPHIVRQSSASGTR